ncbi:hypothetical protein D3261_11020 [Halococcus sp. IIIV-5B]|nr:hypothetical protein D3261_11020 [Halococcus sp. IIIV-5B]
MEATASTDEDWWSWQWSATFTVLFGYFLGAMLWIDGFQIPAGVIGGSSAVLGMYTIAAG